MVAAVGENVAAVIFVMCELNVCCLRLLPWLLSIIGVDAFIVAVVVAAVACGACVLFASVAMSVCCLRLRLRLSLLLV